MANYTILSLNVRGLNSAFKRSKVLELLKRKNVDVALLSETHLKPTDVRRMQNKHYRLVASSGDGSKTKGVMILMKRRLNLAIEKISSNNSGRLAYCGVSIQGKKVAFASIYAPTSFDPSYFPWLTKELLCLSNYSLIVGSDMNTFFDHNLDRSNPSVTHSQALSSNALKNFAKDINLVDIWRVQNPTARDYTYFSPYHKMFSRIDYILATPNLIPTVDEVVFLPRIISDHNPIITSFNLDFLQGTSSRWRFNTTLLKNEKYLSQLKTRLVEFININKDSVSDNAMVWSAIKGFLRHNAIGFSSYLKKCRLQKISQLEQTCSNLERELKDKYSNEVETKLKSVKTELDDILRQRVEFLMHTTKHRYYTDSSKPSRLLALTLKRQENQFNIPSINCPVKGLVTKTADINSAFKSFFENLYSSEDRLSPELFDSFFDKLNLPALSDNESEELDAPLTLHELHTAVKLTNRGRSPGIDGIPAELYLELWNIIGPIWLDTINAAIGKGCFHKDLNTALISVLPKPGKDPQNCASYRPISLINADIKIYSKVIAMRLDKVMGKLINPDQTGFLKGRFASDNVRRLLHVIADAKKIGLPGGLLFLDAEKAFDRLEWGYLWRVLEKFNFGPNFIKMIQVLYSNPSARVVTAGQLSALFNIGRGSRQGCPASPAIFNLSIEPLAQYIRQSTLVTPIKIGSTSHSISMYADDTLVYLSNIQQSLPNVLKIIEHFGALSGYKLNYSKSILLLLNTDLKKLNIQPRIPVAQKAVYLGIEISPCIQSIAKNNYSSILKKLEDDLNRWAALPSSLPARVATIKMNVLPRINFVSSMLPLPTPAGFWQKLDTKLRKFIWNGKKSRIKLSTLQRDKPQGGWACPNFKLYHWAFVLRSLKQWFDAEPASPWKTIEQELVHPLRLKDVAFSGLKHKKCYSQFGPIISYVIQTMANVEKYMGFKSKWHKQSPIWHNANLLTGGEPFISQSWAEHGILTLGDISGQNAILDLPNLISHFGISKSSQFLYFRVRSALNSLKIPWGAELRIHPLVSLIEKSPRKKTVSYIYNNLLSYIPTESPECRSCEADIHLGTESINWDTVWENVFQSSKNPKGGA